MSGEDVCQPNANTLGCQSTTEIADYPALSVELGNQLLLKLPISALFVAIKAGHLVSAYKSYLVTWPTNRILPGERNCS